MKQILSLMKKDFLLIRKYIPLTLLISIIATIFTSMETPEFQKNGFILYIMLAPLLTFITYHMITMEEIKSKGMVYIHTTPMTYGFIGLSKFVVITVSFLMVTIVYIILSKIDITKVGSIGLKDILFTYTLVNLFFSIYIPLTYKLGYTKVQLVNGGLIMITPFIVGNISDILTNNGDVLLKILNIPNTLFAAISILVIITIISISIKATSLILSNKEY